MVIINIPKTLQRKIYLKRNHIIMGLVEKFASLPLIYVLIIVAIVKFSLIVCLCSLDLCTSDDPVPLQSNGSHQLFRRKEEKDDYEEEQ